MTAAPLWKQNNINMSTNMLALLAEGNVCDELENALRLTVVQYCNRHIEYIDKRDSVVNSYSISRWGLEMHYSFTLWA
jgi:hypothetical protein